MTSRSRGACGNCNCGEDMEDEDNHTSQVSETNSCAYFRVVHDSDQGSSSEDFPKIAGGNDGKSCFSSD